jgi:hypothetical protein
MNRVKLLSAAAILSTALAAPALAEGGHGAVGQAGGGMATGAGQSVGGSAVAPSAGAAVAPSAGGGMRGSSANIGAGAMVRGDGGRNFAAGGGDRGDWRHDHGREGRFAIGAGFGYPYGYDSYASYGGDCYLVRRRVPTPFGWRLRRVQVCD